MGPDEVPPGPWDPALFKDDDGQWYRGDLTATRHEPDAGCWWGFARYVVGVNVAGYAVEQFPNQVTHHRHVFADQVLEVARGWRVVDDAVGLAAYTMDSHNCQRIARLENGVWTARNEGNVVGRKIAPEGEREV